MATGALVGLGAAAVGAIAGSATSVATNKSNASIAQDNNEFNEKMLDKQLAYNTEMYEKQLGDQWNFYNDAKQNSWDLFNATNEYNSASAQRQRYEAAGLNPYLMMSGGNAGTATSSATTSATSPSAQGVTPPTATPYSADYSGVGQAFGDLADRVLNEPKRDVERATADNLRIEGKYKAAKTMAEIINLRTDAKTKEGRLALDKLIYSIDKDLKVSTMEVNKESIAKMRAERKFTNVQTLIADKQLSFMDASQKMDLAQKTADIQLKYAQGALTRKQVEHEIKKIAETEVRTSLGVDQITGQQLSNQAQRQENRFNADTYNDRVKTVKETLWNLIYGTDSVGIFKTLGRFSRSVAPFVSDGVHN